MCIRQSTDETSNTKNTVTHHWATKWPNSTFLKLEETRYGGIYSLQIGNSHCAHLIEEKESRGLFCPLEPKHHVCNRTGQIIQFWCFISKKWRLIKINQIGAFCYLPDQMKNSCNLQFRTKLLEKVFPIMSTFLRNKTISKTTPLRKENPFPQFNVASHKRPGIRLSFEYTTTLLSGEGGEGRTGTATMFRKMLSKYSIFSTVLSKIVGREWGGRAGGWWPI